MRRYGWCWQCLPLKSATETGAPPGLVTMSKWKPSALCVSSSGNTRSLGSVRGTRCGLETRCIACGGAVDAAEVFENPYQRAVSGKVKLAVHRFALCRA
eukprot:4347548-Pleurochrysis_carterae.AAC.1